MNATLVACLEFSYFWFKLAIVFFWFKTTIVVNKIVKHMFAF